METRTRIVALEGISYNVLSKINEIASIDLDDGEETIEDKRTRLSKETSRIMKEYVDQVSILRTDLANFTDQDSKYQLQVLEDKIPNLKILLRESLMRSYVDEKESIHRRRKQKYEEVASPSKGEEELIRVRDIPKSKDETIQAQILERNKSITASLQAARQLMSTTILQTELDIDSIDQQSKDLAGLNEKLTDFEVLLKKSKQIVKFIEKQDRQDKNRIYLSFLFLALCCMWVLWRRLFKVPVKILIWSLFKLLKVFSFFGGSASQRFKNYDVASAPSLVTQSASVVNQVQEVIVPIENSIHETWTESMSIIKDEL